MKKECLVMAVQPKDDGWLVLETFNECNSWYEEARDGTGQILDHFVKCDVPWPLIETTEIPEQLVHTPEEDWVLHFEDADLENE